MLSPASSKIVKAKRFKVKRDIHQLIRALQPVKTAIKRKSTNIQKIKQGFIQKDVVNQFKRQQKRSNMQRTKMSARRQARVLNALRNLNKKLMRRKRIYKRRYRAS